ncbi:TPR-like protein [Cylindrobasidium torrendii FP15055 ss-10]|uniref:TPR-like protein n=1 Tax=Cylindrobasidium torrendii FP15055 ss-10 TaxID=1314674 RepID=A0A0D7AZM0_9AGAR|nr:TPR-like protein [Cylindrobasidium torrendii FP15055 ss-10]
MNDQPPALPASSALMEGLFVVPRTEPIPSPPAAPDVGDIRRTIAELEARHLRVAAAWVSEMLCAIPESIRAKCTDPPHELAPEPEDDYASAALGSLQAHEFNRSANLLKHATSPRARFLAIYAQYLGSERAALQEWHTMDGTRHQTPLPVNASLPDLYGLLEGSEDPFLQFLEGLFLYRLQRRQAAIKVISASLKRVPWNWSAWNVLNRCIHTYDEYEEFLSTTSLDCSHPAFYCWHVQIKNDLTLNADPLCVCLLKTYASNEWLNCQRSRALYVNNQAADALSIFETVLKGHPARTQDLDTLAIQLYLSGNSEKLGSYAAAVDHAIERPEGCILIGLSLSLRRYHEKACRYFLRATYLDPTCGMAYNFLGQTLIDLHNTYAGIHMFKRATDLSPKDTRAWHGLCQAYRYLQMPSYALQAARQSLKARPHDAHMWEQAGICFEELGRPHDAASMYLWATGLSPPGQAAASLYFKFARLTNDAVMWDVMIARVEAVGPVNELYVMAINARAVLLVNDFAYDSARTLLQKALPLAAQYPEEVDKSKKTLAMLPPPTVAAPF